MIDWDADSDQLKANLEGVLTAARKSARERRTPSLSLVRDWHRDMSSGLTPEPPAAVSWVGRFRGEEGQERVGVRIGVHAGTHPALVARELDRFERRLTSLVERLDGELPAGTELDAAAAETVLSLMSWVHNEWVRIHPYANGNGRIGRIWANWVALRYGLPPFVRLRPRPAGDADAEAAGAAMSGQVLAMIPVFRAMLMDYPGDASTHS